MFYQPARAKALLKVIVISGLLAITC